MSAEPGRTAYEARFAGFTLGPRGVSPAWADLPEQARAVWRRVERAVLAESAVTQATVAAALRDTLQEKGLCIVHADGFASLVAELDALRERQAPETEERAT